MDMIDVGISKRDNKRTGLHLFLVTFIVMVTQFSRFTNKRMLSKERLFGNLYLARFIFLFSFSFSYASEIVWNGQKYDDRKVSELITVITTSNPIPSIPKTDHLYEAQKSLFRIGAFALCKKIIVFDGVQPSYEDRRDEYEEYKKNIEELLSTDPYFFNTEIVSCSSWVHLSGAIKEAIKLVATPFIYIHQHDLKLVKDFDLNGVVASMVANPNIKHVKLNWRARNNLTLWWDGPVDSVVDGIHFVPLTRTFGWSDNDHVTTKEYYENFVLPACGHGPMEKYLHPALIEAVRRN